MGLTFADVEINGRRYRALVDTGYYGRVIVSGSVAKELNLTPIGEDEKVLADGRRVKVKIAVARLKVDDRERHAIIEVLDELPLDVLLGVIALEELGYMVDPRTGTIIKGNFNYLPLTKME